MQRKRGICSECDNDKEVFLARVHPPQCLFHYQKQKSIEYAEKSKAKQKSDPKKKKAWSYKREPTGEGELFRRIWEKALATESGPVSFVSGTNLGREARSWYFSHCLPKGRYQNARLDVDNVQLMTFEEHETWEYKQYKIKDDPKWKHVFELKERLLEKYKNHE